MPRAEEIPNSVASSLPSRKPRILVVVHSLEVGGAEMVAVTLAERLREDFDFEFLCLDRRGPLADRLEEHAIRVHTLERSPGFDRRLVGQFRTAMKKARPALVHNHQCTPWIYAQVARIPSASPPLLVTEHGRFHPDFRNPKRVLANRLLIRRSDRAVAVGEGVKTALATNEGIPQSRISVIYNGIDLARFEASATGGREVRRALGLADTDRIALHVARLDTIKDHDTALRAMERLSSEIPELKLLIVGEGPEADRIDARIEELGLASTARRLGLRADVPDLLAASDLLLLTSVSEGIPLALIEAMAARVPIVSTDVGGVSEVVGTSALLVPPGDDEELAAAVARLCREPDLGPRLSQAGKERALRHFSLDAMAHRYRELYNDMIRGSG